ncbi:hypothetical protein CTI12_AA009970 [Artemisia annua]|uniref:Uncharacterized protein n=1 Tax=Artemisia annua TaxID=35608 RepID=A0A2U1QMR5_ARTAN|nr:hypothetical protein CTI12_AA009970 [Artemisia annua]
MAPKYPKCLEIGNQIGDRRVEKVLHAIFSREKKAYVCDETYYNERVEEVKVRIEQRHQIIMELKKMARECVLDEYLVDLKDAERKDLDEIGWLIKKSYSASLRAADKGRMVKKLKRFF